MFSKKKLLFISGVFITFISILLIHFSIVHGEDTTDDVNRVPAYEEEEIQYDGATRAKAERYGRNFGSWLESSINGNVVPAVCAGVVQGDKLIYSHGVNADLDTQFGIASLSKTFTAILILRLAQEGLLVLDHPITRYLPEVVIERSDINSSPVTIRHLLAHTSGMPSYGRMTSATLANGRRVSYPAQVHPAGYSYSYCNDGYVILMHIIEAATGRSYSQNMRDKVLLPLNMKSSTASYSNGTGGLRTTLRDLSKYTTMLIHGGIFKGQRFLTQKSYNDMLAKNVELPRTKVDYYYSLSWEVISVKQKVDSYYKAGRWFNEASAIHVFPEKQIALMYLCNPPQHLTSSFMAWRQQLTGQLRSLLRRITGDRKLCTSWPWLPSDKLRNYEGKYVNPTNGARINIKYRRGRLFRDNTPLKVFTSNRFTFNNGRGIHNFVWKGNKVVGLAIRNGYYKLVN